MNNLLLRPASCMWWSHACERLEHHHDADLEPTRLDITNIVALQVKEAGTRTWCDRRYVSLGSSFLYIVKPSLSNVFAVVQ